MNFIIPIILLLLACTGAYLLLPSKPAQSTSSTKAVSEPTSPPQSVTVEGDVEYLEAKVLEKLKSGLHSDTDAELIMDVVRKEGGALFDPEGYQRFLKKVISSP